MALTAKQRAKQLESLLNAVERGNKKDAADYTSGYLNESNLYQPPEFSTHKPWNGAKKTQTSTQPSKLPTKTLNKANGLAKQNGMTDVLSQFSIGNDGFLPSVKKKKLKKSNKDKNYWGGEVTGSVDEQALIEEIDSRRFMLNRSQPTRMYKSWAIEDENETPRSKSQSVPPKHEFYDLKSGATKRDQLKDLRLFENGTIRKHEALVSHVLSGEQGVQHIEHTLNRVSFYVNKSKVYNYTVNTKLVC